MKLNQLIALLLSLLKLAALILALEAAGCASYWQDRWRDAADLLTATIETETFGLKTQIGPLAPGIYSCSSDATGLGLIGGQITRYEVLDSVVAPFLAWVQKYRGFDDDRRRKEFHALGSIFQPYWAPQTNPHGYFSGFRVADDWRRLAPRYTQIEVFAGIHAGGIRLGLNPGELLDLLLGWCFLDLYGDDQCDEDTTPVETPVTPARETVLQASEPGPT